MNDTRNPQKPIQTTGQPELTRGGQTYVPAVDIIEKGDELLLMADVPGARAEGIDIQYERGLLTIQARVNARQPEGTSYTLREYGVGDFVRTFHVGETIDTTRIQAQLSQGVLTLHLPKAEAAKTRKIAVKTT